MVVINLVGVRAYGELEYWFSILKVLTIIIFIICAILVDAGLVGQKVKYGMDAWHIDGAPFKGGFLGFVKTLVSVGYAYGGSEMTGVTAAESRNPHKHVPRAVNTVLLRIAFFYIISIFLLGSIIRNDDPKLDNAEGTAAAAPFTIVFLMAGMSAAANYMNAVVFTSVFSAINSDFYVSTRMLLSLARNGWAHKQIGYTNSRGVPVVALAIVTLCSCLSLITIFVGSGVVFSCDLPYRSWGYPYGNILATVIGVCCIVATCYLSVINPPKDPGPGASEKDISDFHKARDSYAQNLLGAWFPWVCSAFLYFGYKFVRKTKIVKAEEADLDTGRFIPTESDKEDINKKGPLWKRIISFLI
ncbi:hypothetical protein BGZ89_005185 [Linnemannia elongata]|nr:hypothetical protein BGZ89_005185 [Linnemannia elongata]